MAAPFRTIATMPGVRHLVAMPISAVHKLASGERGRAEQEKSEGDEKKG